MIEIKLKDNETGYSIVAEYIYRYWKQFGYPTGVLVHLDVSFDGEDWFAFIEYASSSGVCGKDVEFDNDWWEGEKYIRLYGIRAIDTFKIEGGIYEE